MVIAYRPWNSPFAAPIYERSELGYFLLGIPNFTLTPQAEIDRCLGCNKPQCTNCLHYIHAMKRV